MVQTHEIEAGARKLMANVKSLETSAKTAFTDSSGVELNNARKALEAYMEILHPHHIVLFRLRSLVVDLTKGYLDGICGDISDDARLAGRQVAEQCLADMVVTNSHVFGLTLGCHDH